MSRWIQEIVIIIEMACVASAEFSETDEVHVYSKEIAGFGDRTKTLF